MNDDLVAFLRARLDEDERLAADAAKHCASLIAAAARTEGIWEPPYDGSAWGSSADHVYAADPRGDQPRADIADFGAGAFMLTPHIQNHSPARVLVEVDAKRRMIALHEQAATDTESSDYLVAAPGGCCSLPLTRSCGCSRCRTAPTPTTGPSGPPPSEEPPVSWLQFIADIKWAVVALVALAVVSRKMKRVSPETRQAVRDSLLTRKLRVKLGDAEAELGEKQQLAEAVSAAAASDEELQAQIQQITSGEPSPEEVQQVRRSAIDEIIRQTVHLTWEIRNFNFVLPPIPHVEWDEDRPRVTYGGGSEGERHRALMAAAVNAHPASVERRWMERMLQPRSTDGRS